MPLRRAVLRSAKQRRTLPRARFVKMYLFTGSQRCTVVGSLGGMGGCQSEVTLELTGSGHHEHTTRTPTVHHRCALVAMSLRALHECQREAPGTGHQAPQWGRASSYRPRQVARIRAIPLLRIRYHC